MSARPACLLLLALSLPCPLSALCKLAHGRDVLTARAPWLVGLQATVIRAAPPRSINESVQPDEGAQNASVRSPPSLAYAEGVRTGRRHVPRGVCALTTAHDCAGAPFSRQQGGWH